MSRFIQSLVDQRYVDMALGCWWYSEQSCRLWTGMLLYDLVCCNKKCSCLRLGDSGFYCLAMQVSAAWWYWSWSAGVCCLVMSEQVEQVCCKSCWLLCRHFVVSTKRCSEWSSEEFLKLALKRAGYDFSGISSEKSCLREFWWLVGNWHQQWLSLQLWLVGSHVSCSLLGQTQIPLL